MICPQCEDEIAQKITHRRGVLSCRASYCKSSVTAQYDPDIITPGEIKSALSDIGYPVGSGKSGLISDMIGAACVIVLYFALPWLTGLVKVPQAEAGAGAGILFVIGLLTGVHCIGMCGGIMLTQKNAVAYNAGRLLSYTALGALFGAIGVLIIPVIIIIAVICTISGGSKGENASVGSLTGDEATIAQYLIDKGVDRTHIAAIMGNMFQESGCHPTALNSSSGAYGICQWLGGRKTGLENLAKEKGKDMSDLSVQLDWFWEEFAESCSGWNKAKYKVFCAQSDLKQCVYLFRSQFERCGESEAADANRLAQAQRIYDALGTSNGTNGIDGNGQDLKKATRRQKDVVNAANTTKSPGQGWCAAWVTNVFQSAGIGYFGGNACDMCRAYCTSTNVRDLKVGMIIADVSHPGTGEAGRLYGHVGIYIGDNKVISNEGAITIKSLQEFVGFYGKGTGCKWGWLGGVDLSK